MGFRPPVRQRRWKTASAHTRRVTARLLKKPPPKR